jgi:hypothetical protein
VLNIQKTLSEAEAKVIQKDDRPSGFGIVKSAVSKRVTASGDTRERSDAVGRLRLIVVAEIIP